MILFKKSGKINDKNNTIVSEMLRIQ